MKLAYWMYAGPAHIGTLRVASSFKNVYAIMHAPLGDDYFNVMKSMLERERDFTPVTASVVDRHVLARGSQEKVVSNITRKDHEEQPDLIVLTPTCLGFHNQHDISELKKIFRDLNIDLNLVIPGGASVNDLKDLPRAWFNIVPYRETGLMAAEYLKKEFNIPYVSTSPIGIIETASFIREIQSILNVQGYVVSFEDYIHQQTKFISQSAWFSRSIDCQNLTGKRAVVFGDSTHAAAITKVLCREMGIHVSWAGTYCKNDEQWFRSQVEGLCDNVVITEDHCLIADLIAKTEPSAIFGTQMERHIGKRLNIPCGVISSPVHIQNFPLKLKRQ